VHAHLPDVGAAIEAALDLGRLRRIRVTALDELAAGKDRTVIAAVTGDGLAEAVRTMGGVPVRAALDDDLVQELTRAVEHTEGDVVVLPNGMLTNEAATSLVSDGSGRRVAVIPTAAQTQGIAALAVHEPTADFDIAVAAMSAAARHARHAGVTIAQGPEITAAGPSKPGDVLGTLEGDVVEIGDSVAEVGWRVIQRLLASGGELLTLITGADAEPEIAEVLATQARQAVDGLEVEVLDGGQRPYVLLVGLE
jgi:uncharacterized protein